FIAGFQAFSHDVVARRAGADAAASMVQTGLDALANVEDAARNAIVAVRNFSRVHVDGCATRKKGNAVISRSCSVPALPGARIRSRLRRSQQFWRVPRETRPQLADLLVL